MQGLAKAIKFSVADDLAGGGLPEDNGLREKTKLSQDAINILYNEIGVYHLEIKVQNEELRASYLTIDLEREKFEGLYDLAPIGYFVMNHLGVIEDVNTTGVELLGISKATLIKRRFQSFVSPCSWEDINRFLLNMKVKNGKQHTELQLTLPDARTIFIRLDGIAIGSAVPEDINYHISVIDITESINSKQILKDTRDRLEMTLKASSTGTWNIDCGGPGTVFLDQHSLDILEIEKFEFGGTVKDMIELVHVDDLHRVRQLVLKSINGLKEIDIEFKIRIGKNKIKHIAVKGHEIRTYDKLIYFAGIVIDITDRKNLEREAENILHEQQKLILSATLNTQEKERNNISTALHDSVCQLLYCIRLKLESTDRVHHLPGGFKEIYHLLDLAIKETRHISSELTPSVLRDFGLSEAVKEMALLVSTDLFQVETYVDHRAVLMDTEIQLYVFRMIQELINNCIKHAKATRADIRVGMNSNMVMIRVADNGIGLKDDVEQAIKGGLGISGIKNRVYLLNGKIDFNTAKKGLTVNIQFKNVNGLKV